MGGRRLAVGLGGLLCAIAWFPGAPSAEVKRAGVAIPASGGVNLVGDAYLPSECTA